MTANSSLGVSNFSILSLSWRQLLSELLPFWQCYSGSACWLFILYSVQILRSLESETTPFVPILSVCPSECVKLVSVIQTHPQLQTIVYLICLSFCSFRHLYMRIKKLSPTGENEAFISQHTEISLNHGSHSQMSLWIRQITQQNTVCWQEIVHSHAKKDWCPSITFQENNKKSGLLYDCHNFPMLASDWNSLRASYSQKQT